MSFLETLKKVEDIILGGKNETIKSKDHWKKYLKPKLKQNS